MIHTLFGLAVMLFLLAAGSEAWGLGALTGTWQGNITCKVQVDGDQETIATKQRTMFISHNFVTASDAEVNVLLDSGHHYRGLGQPRNGCCARGAVTVAECRTDPTSPFSYSEVLSANVTAQTFKGTSVFKDSAFNAVGGICTWNFRLVDPANPNVPPC